MRSRAFRSPEASIRALPLTAGLRPAGQEQTALQSYHGAVAEHFRVTSAEILTLSALLQARDRSGSWVDACRPISPR